jgi:fucose 4-O-acetylase-like acetyltransferase
MSEMETKLSSKPRIEFIDLAKGVCIILVVLLHLVPVLNDKLEFLSYLRMPLYFCLSGLFFKDYGSLKNFTVRKVNKILIPFIAWYLISYMIFYLGRMVSNSDHEAVYSITDVFLRNEIFNIPLWFLLCLFWSNLLFACINIFLKKWYQQFGAIAVMAGVGYMMGSNHIANPLYIGSALTCMPFFYLGYVLKRSSILYSNANKKVERIVLGISLIGAMLFAIIPDSFQHFEFYTNSMIEGNIVAVYISGVMYVVAILLLCKLIGKLPYISWLGRYSIVVLVTHLLVNTFVNRGLCWGLKASPDELWMQLLCFVINIAAMALVIPLVLKYLPHITAQKDLITSNKKETSSNLVKQSQNGESHSSNNIL